MTPPDTQAKLKKENSAVTVFPASVSFGKKPLLNAAAANTRLSIVPSSPTEAPSAALTADSLHAVPAAPTSKPEEIFETTERSLSPYLQKSYDIIWKVLRQTLDTRKIASLKKEDAITEIMISIEQISQYEQLAVSRQELEMIGKIIIDEMLGLGPIESLLAREDISEIMVNGPDTVYIEVDGVVEKCPIKFRDNEQLVHICQRIANQVGRRVDEAGPICDARLADGSRVNIILPPLSLDGATLTIRKFKRDKLTLDKLLAYGAISPLGAELIKIIAACRTNIIVSGGTGSGKTTMLNCLTRYIHPRERIVTCEDSAELQLQQPHVVRLETRPPNLEGVGEATMRDLVRNCLRMRPERIIVGEVRGGEAFDLLQAMNTGHDGSMGTVHANNPRDALSRLENMVAMNRLNIPAEAVRQQIASAVNVVIQVQRLRDGSRKVSSISEIVGMENGVILMQDLLSFHITSEDSYGRIIGEFKPSGFRPRFYQRLREFNLEQRFDTLMEEYYVQR